MEKSERMNQISKYDLINGAALAYIGDAVYEQFVRKYVVAKGDTSPHKLHRLAVRYVSAVGQAKVMKHWINNENILTDKEIEMYRRGRNNKANTKAKNASIGDYRQATGFEALIGWLALTEQDERCHELMHKAVMLIEAEEG